MMREGYRFKMSRTSLSGGPGQECSLNKKNNVNVVEDEVANNY